MRMRLITFLLIICILSRGYGLDLEKTKVLVNDNVASDEVPAVETEALKDFPTPAQFFNSAKQLFAGYPFVVMSSMIDKFCSAAIASKAVKPMYTPDIRKMEFQLLSNCRTEYFPLLEAEKILESPNFNPNKKVVVLATGWTSNVNNTDMIKDIGKAYLCRGDTNVIAIDSANFIDTLYTWSAFNTDLIGQHIAEGLSLIARQVPVKNIHLIGHSLGAHIVGSAGRYFTSMTNQTLPRITGLDPAKPCFTKGRGLSGLSRGNADFVDVIHTNVGVLGERDAVGDADFYPGGFDPLKPGCFDISCAHGRAYEYYAESVYPGNEQNFMGTRCSSLKDLSDGKCTEKAYPMGYACPYLQGQYFLQVKDKSPYGEKGDAQRANDQRACGLCD